MKIVYSGGVAADNADVENMPYDKYDASCNRYYREPYFGCREYEPEINGIPMRIFQIINSGGENG